MERGRRASLVLGALTLIFLVGVVTVLGVGAASSRSSTGSSQTALPSFCSRPGGGFLVVISGYGYNDSILQGAGPSKPWPVIQVQLGQTVKITVCNVDVESHGFQVSNYEQAVTNIIEPGHSMTFTFAATKEGTIGIYCEIPCDLHPYLQYGQLRVAG